MTYTAKIIIERGSAKELLEDVKAVTYLLDHLRAGSNRRRARAPQTQRRARQRRKR